MGGRLEAVSGRQLAMRRTGDGWTLIAGRGERWADDTAGSSGHWRWRRARRRGWEVSSSAWGWLDGVGDAEGACSLGRCWQWRQEMGAVGGEPWGLACCRRARGGARPEKGMGADGRRDAAGSVAGEDDVGVLTVVIY
ncbi:hypothetical protein ACLOJK_034515 [Asimina triloba]